MRISDALNEKPARSKSSLPHQCTSSNVVMIGSALTGRCALGKHLKLVLDFHFSVTALELGMRWPFLLLMLTLQYFILLLSTDWSWALFWGCLLSPQKGRLDQILKKALSNCYKSCPPLPSQQQKTMSMFNKPGCLLFKVMLNKA